MTPFDLSLATLWRVSLFVLLALALYAAREILVILFVAIILSAGLDAPVSFFERYRVPRMLSTIIIFLFAASILGVIFYSLIPVAVAEMRAFLDYLAEPRVPILGAVDASALARAFHQSIQNFSGTLLSGGASLLSFLSGVFGNVVLVLATIVLTFYLTIDKGGIEKFLRAILPLAHEERAIALYYRVRRRFGLWLQGQLILMVTVGVLVFFGLWSLGVPYALVIALLTGLLEIVPVVGPIFAGAVAFLIALSQSSTLALYVILLFVVIQQLENHLLVPLIMQRTVGVNTVVVVIALLLGSQIAGFIGVLLAVPVVVIIQEVLEDWGAEKARQKGARLEM